MAITGSTYVNLTADGAVSTAACKLCSISITASSDTASAIVYDSLSATGTVICKISATAGTTEQINFGQYPATASTGVYVDMSGTTPYVTGTYV